MNMKMLIPDEEERNIRQTQGAWFLSLWASDPQTQPNLSGERSEAKTTSLLNIFTHSSHLYS